MPLCLGVRPPGVPGLVFRVQKGKHQPPGRAVRPHREGLQKKPSASGAHARGVSGATVSVVYKSYCDTVAERVLE